MKGKQLIQDRINKIKKISQIQINLKFLTKGEIVKK